MYTKQENVIVMHACETEYAIATYIPIIIIKTNRSWLHLLYNYMHIATYVAILFNI